MVRSAGFLVSLHLVEVLSLSLKEERYDFPDNYFEQLELYQMMTGISNETVKDIMTDYISVHYPSDKNIIWPRFHYANSKGVPDSGYGC